jgi:hypothetical protein
MGIPPTNRKKQHKPFWSRRKFSVESGPRAEPGRNANLMMSDEVALCFNDTQACSQDDPDLLDPQAKGMEK